MKRTGETHSLADFIPSERARIMDGTSPVRREQMRAAESSRSVYRAWNEVCAGTREGAHVTGLHYVPESNELIVYADGSSWVGELTMMREIIRARMLRHGANIADIKVRLSRGGYPAGGRVKAPASSVSSSSSPAATASARRGSRVTAIPNVRARSKTSVAAPEGSPSSAAPHVSAPSRTAQRDSGATPVVSASLADARARAARTDGSAAASGS